jgi:hypothetical protein
MVVFERWAAGIKKCLSEEIEGTGAVKGRRLQATGFRHRESGVGKKRADSLQQAADSEEVLCVKAAARLLVYPVCPVRLLRSSDR